MTKMTFMIAAIASVVIVRDGKRKVVSAGSGDKFTEEEIASINTSLPGALRRPVNESTAAQIAEEDEGEPAPAKTTSKGKAKAETAAQKKKREAAEAKAAAAEEGDDEDEDEDI